MTKTVFALFTITILYSSLAAQLTINEVYPGGGNSGASYDADFVELYNSGNTAVDLTGFTLWYATATGTFGASVDLQGSVPPFGYFLLRTTSPGANGSPLPGPDQAAASPNLSSVNGNLLLTDPTFTAQNNFVCPAAGTPGVVDRIAYGTGNCPESSAAPSPGNNSNSLQRISPGLDSDNNFADFSPMAATPQASGTTAAEMPIEGSVLLKSGRGVFGALITVSGGQLSIPLRTRTNHFGRFNVYRLAAGQTYIVEVSSRTHLIENSTRIVPADGKSARLVFIAREVAGETEQKKKRPKPPQ